MSKISEEQARQELEKDTEKVTEGELHSVINKREKIESKFEKSDRLNKFVSELKLLFSLIKDYANGSYREIPWKSIAAVVAALLYVLNPIDLIPDFIPGVGMIDDALVITACLSMVDSDLRAYKNWKNRQIV